VEWVDEEWGRPKGSSAWLFCVVLIICSVFQTEVYWWDDGERDVLGDT